MATRATTPSTAVQRGGVPEGSDPLGETLHLLRLNGTLYSRSEMTAPWGLDLPEMKGCMMFHVVMSGGGWVTVPGEEPVRLQTGSLVLIPHGGGHQILSGLDVAPDPLFDLPVEQVSDRYEVLRHGGGGELSQAMCGVVRFDDVAAQRLIDVLPKVIHIEPDDQEEGSWLASTIRFIAREARELRPGGETMITRLADILVVQAIRAWIESTPAGQAGWLGALQDERIGLSLMSIHREPGRGWTVSTLANEAGMSRSGFSARFSDLVGEPVMRYLTSWRMQIARTRLLESEEPVAAISSSLGYRSEASFCRAFRREFLCSPSAMRQRTRVA